jgi:hypothetical protein
MFTTADRRGTAGHSLVVIVSAAKDLIARLVEISIGKLGDPSLRSG